MTVMKFSILKSTALILMTMAATKAYSQEIFDYTKNPFGLVYAGAITENRPGQFRP